MVGNITVVTPNTNVTWYVNQTPTIQWNTNGTVGNVSIRLWTGLAWVNITNSTCTGGGCSGIGFSSYNAWTIPLGIKSEDCRINISDVSDPTVYDESDVNFHIRPVINVTSPGLEENVYVSSNNTGLIQWTVTGSTIDFVDIVYDINLI